MERIDAISKDVRRSYIDALAQLIPGVITESRDDQGVVVRAVDFDRLRQELADHVLDGPRERYQLDWPGKRAAILAANAPTRATLRPQRDESVNFEGTRNVFIEGDNLEILKILQESYVGKVKVIYIDPPYNTGGDFIYQDDFAESVEAYLVRTQQVSDTGSRLTANPEANGRFHSDWLSMMLPRLRLARNLLADDGVIFVSIDDAESANLKRLLDEVFGESNFIDTIVVELSTTSGPKTVNAQQGTIVKNAEFIHVYRRSAAFDEIRHTPLLDGVDTFDTHYSMWLHEDGSLGSLLDQLLTQPAVYSDILKFGLAERGTFSFNSMDALLQNSAAAREFVGNNLTRIARIDRAPVSAEGQTTDVGRWREFVTERRTYLITSLANGTLQALMPLALNYRMSDDYKPRFGRTVIRGDLWKGFHQDMGNVAREGSMVFANGKKPTRLIKQLIRWANNAQDGIVLDFFAGSGTTAHAVLEANAEDGGTRRFMLVQLDEAPSSSSQGASPEFPTIAALARERIRRSGREIVKHFGLDAASLDLGFRAFKLDSRGFNKVLQVPDETLQESLLDFAPTTTAGRSHEELLFQAVIDWGLDLSLPFEALELSGQLVLALAECALVACLEDVVDLDLVREIAKRHPLRAIFLDSSFSDDAQRINVEQIFRELSPETQVRVI
jgi:adenine-specific DNA-methyltransferase